MFAVIFEVQPKSDRWDQYLGLAKQLRPELERIDGFIENERYKSRRTEGRLLSLSIWADEKSVIRWRTHAMHHGVQEKGRFEVFEDYHLRVGEITADTQIPSGRTLEQKRFDATEVGAAKAPQRLRRRCTNAGAKAPATASMIRNCSRASQHQGSCCCWCHGAMQPPRMHGNRPPRSRHRRVRVIRDYGMADRREAPQFYPDVARPRRRRLDLPLDLSAEGDRP